MTEIGIFGSEGRMGQAIAAMLDGMGAGHAGGVDKGGDALSLAKDADVLVDFSTPEALAAHLDAARGAGTPILIGTTGLEQAHHDAIDAAAKEIPVLLAANTSLGVNLLAHLVRDAARRLGSDWDIEIVEMHHRHKVDAPSGTALLLGRAAAEGRGIRLEDHAVTAREGQTGPREAGTIGFATLRGGTVIGEHQVILALDQERITLGHIAEDRGVFANGAVAAALWLRGRPPGLYTMSDVLGITS